MFTAAAKKMGCNPEKYEQLVGKVIENAVPFCGYANPQCTKECKEYFEVIIY